MSKCFTKSHFPALKALQSGRPVDLASLPEPPPGYTVESVNKTKPPAPAPPIAQPQHQSKFCNYPLTKKTKFPSK